MNKTGLMRVKYAVKRVLYRVYAARLTRKLDLENLPRHVGVILDGNRRWAKQYGQSGSKGHQAGADKISSFLSWCDEVKIQVVTLWMLSTDNLGRSSEELDALLEIIASCVEDLAREKRWGLRLIGNPALLPEPYRQRILAAVAVSPVTRKPMTVNVAIGYGGREEITCAVRRMLEQYAQGGASLEEVIEKVSIDELSANMYTAGQPDPDLIIRTSGEQRLSGFMLWQTAHTELYFCEAYWPDFRKIDLYRALRDFSQRHRRLGK